MDRVIWLSIVLRPLVALVVFLSAFLLARRALRRTPEGRLNAYLGRPMTASLRLPAQRRDWWPIIWSALGIAVLFTMIWISRPRR